MSSHLPIFSENKLLHLRITNWEKNILRLSADEDEILVAAYTKSL